MKSTSKIQIEVDRQSWNFLKAVYGDNVSDIISKLLMDKAQEIKKNIKKS